MNRTKTKLPVPDSKKTLDKLTKNATGKEGQPPRRISAARVKEPIEGSARTKVGKIFAANELREQIAQTMRLKRRMTARARLDFKRAGVPTNVVPGWQKNKEEKEKREKK